MPCDCVTCDLRGIPCEECEDCRQAEQDVKDARLEREVVSGPMFCTGCQREIFGMRASGTIVDHELRFHGGAQVPVRGWDFK